MSQSYVSGSPGESASDASAKVDTAKQEASDVKDTATQQAKNVAGTVKDEAKSVAGEAKSQAKNLYAQTTKELGDQAGTQQQKVASGLRSAGDELGSMADNSQNGGVAADLVRNVSGRLGSAASWLEDRDPQSVFEEVKNYARRRPAVFIGGALVLGLVAGRLTRALAANAHDEAAPTDTGTDVTPSYSGDTDYVAPAGFTSGYASSLPDDTSSSGVYAAGLSGTAGDGSVYDAGTGGALLDDTGIDAVSLDDAAAGNAFDTAIPGGATNVGSDENLLTDEDTPLYAQSSAAWNDTDAEAGDDVRPNSV